jgi:hypothetical protein
MKRTAEFDDEAFRLCPAAKYVSGKAVLCFAGPSSVSHSTSLTEKPSAKEQHLPLY